MCSIIGSFNLQRLKELSKLNEYRGTHSWSFSRVTKHGDVITKRGFGPLPIDKLTLEDTDTGSYYIAHQQAPTTSNKTESSIHPAVVGHMNLWHNGIIKSHDIRRMQDRLNSSSTWDTELMLKLIDDSDEVTDAISTFDGTFACILTYYGVPYVFRNEISPMFMNDDLDFSSTKFEGSKQLPPNRIYHIDINERVLEPTAQTFTTKENPFYFGE